MRRCKDCRYWKETVHFKTWKECSTVAMLGIDDLSDDDLDRFALVAYADDYATVLTGPEFSCSKFVEKAEE